MSDPSNETHIWRTENAEWIDGRIRVQKSAKTYTVTGKEIWVPDNKKEMAKKYTLNINNGSSCFIPKSYWGGSNKIWKIEGLYFSGLTVATSDYEVKIGTSEDSSDLVYDKFNAYSNFSKSYTIDSSVVANMNITDGIYIYVTTWHWAPISVDTAETIDGAWVKHDGRQTDGRSFRVDITPLKYTSNVEGEDTDNYYYINKIDGSTPDTIDPNWYGKCRLQYVYPKFTYWFITTSDGGYITINGAKKESYSFDTGVTWKFSSMVSSNGEITTTFHDTTGKYSNVVVVAHPADIHYNVEYLFAQKSGNYVELDPGTEYTLFNYDPGVNSPFYYFVQRGADPDPSVCHFRIIKGSGEIVINGIHMAYCAFKWPTEGWTYLFSIHKGIPQIVFNYFNAGARMSNLVQIKPAAPQRWMFRAEVCDNDDKWHDVDPDVEYKLKNVKLDDNNGGFRFTFDYTPAPTDSGYYPVVYCEVDGSLIGKDLTNTNSHYEWGESHKIVKDSIEKIIEPWKYRWQAYQSSGIIKKEYKGQQLLKKTINVFYKVEDPVQTNVDPMRIVIASAELGTLDFGEIQSITDNYKALLTQIPVLPYGFERSFCMDTGVSRDITVNYKRVMPETPDDRAEQKDSRMWSNKKWQEQLKKFINRWQMRTNGVRLYLLMPGKDSFFPASNIDMSDCYPDINPNPDLDGSNKHWVNAYITNAPNSYSTKSTHMIESSITFRVGTIYPRAAPIPITTVRFVYEGEPDPYGNPKDKYEIYIPTNTYSCLPTCPAWFLEIRKTAFLKWIKGDKEFDPGDMIYIEPDDNRGIMLFMTRTVDATKGLFYCVDGEIEVETPDIIPESTYLIYAVGGGGGGGGSKEFSIHEPYKIVQYGGGGGAGGGTGHTTFIPLESGRFQIKCGKGGEGGSRMRDHHVDGYNGNDSFVYFNRNYEDPVCVGPGGEGGKMSGGRGGSKGGGPGGDGGYDDEEHFKGFDGFGAITEGTINHGKGGKGVFHLTSAQMIFNCGGGGGGKAEEWGYLYGQLVPSYGGNGQCDMGSIDGEKGGGGGGASEKEDQIQTGGKGGTGYVYIVGEFKS